MRIVLVVCLLLAGPAQAEVVYRCVSPKGAVSFQNDPCPAGTTAHKAVPYTPDREEPPQYRRARIEAEMRQRNAQLPSSRAHAAVMPVQTARHPSACEAAKAHRDSVLKAAGLRRTYDLLSRLDANVREACK